MADLEHDEYEIPLRDQRYFGSGLKRKRVKFVQSASEPAVQTVSTSTPSTVADRYLSIVLKQEGSASARDRLTEEPSEDQRTNPGRSTDPPLALLVDSSPESIVCEICHREITAADADRHESSIAHQIALQHSHPPSDVDRRRKGFAVLESQGWDPDSRLGLGAAGEGRLYPVRAIENPEKAGLGLKYAKPQPVEKPVKLDASKVQLLEKEGKKRAEALRNAFYRSEEVEKYLGQEQMNPAFDLSAFNRSKRAGSGRR